MDVKNKEFEQLEDVVLSNSQNEQLTRPIDLRIDVVVLIITFRKQNRVVVLIYSFFFPVLANGRLHEAKRSLGSS